MTLQAINTLVVTLGIPTIIGAFIYIGIKIKTIENLEEDMRAIKPDLKDIRERFFTLEGKTSQMFQTASPVQLLDKGLQALTDSGLKKYIDEKQNQLLMDCDSKKETTAYEVQEHIFRQFDNLEFDEDFDKNIKEYAFQKGVPMTMLRRIGAIYFRDICLNHFKMDAKDIDKEVAN